MAGAQTLGKRELPLDIKFFEQQSYDFHKTWLSYLAHNMLLEFTHKHHACMVRS
jgi:hypothetical protein